MCLFCNDNEMGCQYCNPNNAPSWFSDGSTAPKTHVHNVKIGLHPMGMRMLADNDGSRKCGNCQNLHRYKRSGTWYKCGLIKATSGPATDVKRKWWACEKWEKET